MAGYNYNPYMYGYNGNPYGYNYQMAQNQQMAQNNQQAAQMSSNLITVLNENEARNYPVAPLHSVLMKDENSGYIYCKTMGASQLEAPTFEKYRLIKEEQKQETAQKDGLDNELMDLSLYVEKAVYDDFVASMDGLKKKVIALEKKINKKDVTEDE